MFVKKGTRSLCLIAMALMLAWPAVAGTLTTPNGDTVTFTLFSDALRITTVLGVPDATSFSGLVIRTGQQQFPTPGLLYANTAGWQTLDLGPNQFAISNPYIANANVPTYYVWTIPVKIGLVYLPDTWSVFRYDPNVGFGLTGFEGVATPEPGTFMPLLVALLLAIALRKPKSSSSG